MKWLPLTLLLIAATLRAAPPRDALPLDAPEWPRNYRLHLEGAAAVRLSDGMTITLGADGPHDIAVEHPAKGAPVLRVWSSGRLMRGPEDVPGLAKAVVEGGAGWVQALERSDHAEIVSGWNAQSLAEGAQIYQTLCVVCHGTKEQPGSLPTALRFGEGLFKNGADPYAMFVTLTKGFGQMVAQPQYTTAQKYAVIQYIRETFLRPHNPSQLTDITPAYLAALPRGLAHAEVEKEDRSLPPHQRMELGPALFWTYEIAPGNIAQKGLAVRLDDGPGGVSKGRAWMIYDHDTMRVATATTGAFLNWRGIAFDGSHGTHTALTGERHFINPPGPGWSVAGFEDTRASAKDGRKYGPHTGLKFAGLYTHQSQVVFAADIHGTRVLESPAWLDYGATPVFARTINVADAKQPLRLRVAPESVQLALRGDGVLKKEDGFWIATFSAGAKARVFISRTDAASLDTLAKTFAASLDLAPLTRGGPAQWTQTVTTTSIAGDENAAFAPDEFLLPLANPWQSWLRPGGFDFTPDGRAAVVAMWNGDVWRVDGVMDKAPAKLTWRRIASGLFQPLGVKFRGDDLFITCRDQLTRLRDLNGDGETDFIECFNDDAQVTEHFHEFAMGLQTDAAGNFYYAKSGRHALDSVVPQHGTLLRVSADGAKTDIVATGFRAANGVCVNDDGTFFVTDQEGFWTPKNRINRVKAGGFYGNMYGYTSVTDTADSAMEQPLVWITNAKDRSPAELVWVPKNAWGNLGGSLLNLSYGTGRAFIVPHEEVGGAWQGAVCELPMPAFATGIMRGRFGADGALYTCGMFAWAGNATAPGGFHRLRRTAQPGRLPVSVRAMKGAMSVTFSEPIEAKECAMKVWSLKRTKNYGSKHHDERDLTIRGVKLSDDGRTVTLEIPDLAPTHCYELKIDDRVLHGTIHQLRGAAAEAPALPTAHATRDVEGWSVRVDERLLRGDGATLGERALKLLAARLVAIAVVVPEKALAQLRAITIQLDLDYGDLRVAQYHPSAGWLKANGYAEQLAKCVHIPDAEQFLSPWENHRMPWVVLHELAHGFHDQVLGFDEPRLAVAWQKFRDSGKYKSVLTSPGSMREHYGLHNPKEFFAEMTESYFGSNDFYPFVTGELKRDEPEIFALLAEIWGPLPARSSSKPAAKP